MTAWRVMYHSRDQNGADVAVSGTVVAPKGTAPAGGRGGHRAVRGVRGSALTRLDPIRGR